MKKPKKKKDIHVNIFKGVCRELAPNLIAFVIFLIIAQVIFFTIGPKILIPNITHFGLFLLNFVFAILLPYIFAMIIKAIKLIIDVSKSKK